MKLYDCLGEYLQNRPSSSATGDWVHKIYPSKIFGSFKQTSTDAVIGMASMGITNFDVECIREAVIYHVGQQAYPLKLSTWKMLFKFLGSSFEDQTDRIFLLIFVDLTKMDVEQANRADWAGHKTTDEAYYDNELSIYLSKAVNDYEPAFKISPASPEMILKVTETLHQSAVLLAIERCLQSVSSASSSSDQCWNRDKIMDEIKGLRIYTALKFRPMENLRGATLLDGILLCTQKLAGLPGTVNFDADLATLSCHEFMQFIARKRFGDSNGPMKYFDYSTLLFRTVDSTNLPLELGRRIELEMFDSIQPDWACSSDSASSTFIERLNSEQTLPIISRHEHESLGLKARSGSLQFAFDVEENPHYYFE